MLSPGAAASRGAGWRFLRQGKARFGLAVLGLFGLCGVLAPVLSRQDPNQVNLIGTLQPPGPGHWLGTDDLGRDVLARCLFGARVSFSVAVLAVLLALLMGMPLGLLAGAAGRKVDSLLMRLIDGMLAFPPIVLATAIAATIGGGFHAVVLAIAVMAVPTYARLVRGQALQAMQVGYVEASVAVGCPPLYTAWRHVLPNILSPLLVQSTLHAAHAILLESALGFLGIGIQLPTPSWGTMVMTGSGYLEIAPWLVIVPGVAIFLSVLALNLAGDALRDALDPRLRQR